MEVVCINLTTVNLYTLVLCVYISIVGCVKGLSSFEKQQNEGIIVIQYSFSMQPLIAKTLGEN